MSATPQSASAPPPRHPLVTVLSLLLVVLGLVIGGLGAWLLSLGGSAYYAIAGLGLLVSGILLFGNRRSGALLYALVFVGTLLWTWWESGSDYWRWVPRLGLVTALGIVLALLAPTLREPVSKRLSRSVAGSLMLVFVAAFGLAFAPHGEVDGHLPFPEGAVSAGLEPTRDTTGLQPADQPAEGDWPAWGRSNAGTRYSPLQQITPANVATLQPAWQFRTGDLPKKRWGAETTPLKVGDRLYLCTARNRLIALDASSGKELWRFDPKVKDASIPYTAACRGVSYYEQPSAPTMADAALADVAADLALPEPPPSVTRSATPGSHPACWARIIEGTLDGRIIAVDADSGRPCANFGNNGQVDITLGMGDVPPGYVSINSPPAIVRGVIVTGHQVLDGQRRDAPSA